MCRLPFFPKKSYIGNIILINALIIASCTCVPSYFYNSLEAFPFSFIKMNKHVHKQSFHIANSIVTSTAFL